jgi:hypothetical protein
MMKETVEHSADCGSVSRQFSPVFDRTVGGQQRAGAFVASHDDLQQFFSGRQGQFGIPRSSMMSSGTVSRNSMHSLRVPSSIASASSSSSECVSR